MVIVLVEGPDGVMAVGAGIAHHLLDHAAQAVDPGWRGQMEVPYNHSIAASGGDEAAGAVVLEALERGIGPCAPHKVAGIVVVIAETRAVGIDETGEVSLTVVVEAESVALAVGAGEAGLATAAMPGIAIGGEGVDGAERVQLNAHGVLPALFAYATTQAVVVKMQMTLGLAVAIVIVYTFTLSVEARHRLGNDAVGVFMEGALGEQGHGTLEEVGIGGLAVEIIRKVRQIGERHIPATACRKKHKHSRDDNKPTESRAPPLLAKRVEPPKNSHACYSVRALATMAASLPSDWALISFSVRELLPTDSL